MGLEALSECNPLYREHCIFCTQLCLHLVVEVPKGRQWNTYTSVGYCSAEHRLLFHLCPSRLIICWLQTSCGKTSAFYLNLVDTINSHSCRNLSAVFMCLWNQSVFCLFCQIYTLLCLHLVLEILKGRQWITWTSVGCRSAEHCLVFHLCPFTLIVCWLKTCCENTSTIYFHALETFN